MKSCLFAIALIVALVFSGCSKQKINNTQEEILFDQPVPVRFGTGRWTLFIGFQGVVGEPIVVYMKLFAKNERTTEKIKKPEDMNKLTGLSIRNSDEAISFLRLFTSHTSYVMFDEPRAIEQHPDAVRVVQQDNGFVVTRELLMASSEEPHGYPVLEFQEKVTFDGKYELLSKKSVTFVPFEKYPFPIIL
ncbi:MAG: hypothetical protein PHO37_16750 [Kiritimatiellae bacterium]|nr:hypothetical protein [Kiritimatiellia bacterium]